VANAASWSPTDIGRPFYRAVTTLGALALIEEPPPVRRAVRSRRRRTRTQRIRTAASISVEAIIFDDADLPVYLRIADKAKQLRELGLSDRAIANALAVSDKTVAKAAGGAPASRPEVVPTTKGFS
jgi:hypothetical protein